MGGVYVRSHERLTLYSKDKRTVAAESVSLQAYQCFTHSAGITIDQICPFIFAVQGRHFCQMQTGSKLNTQSTVEKEEKEKKDSGRWKYGNYA